LIVAFNALSVRPGVVDGGSTFALNLLRHLPGALSTHELVAYVRDGEDRVPQASNLRVVPVAVRSGYDRVLRETLWLGRDMQRRSVDALVSPNESIPLFTRAVLVVIAQNLVYHGMADGLAFTGSRPRERVATALQFAYYRRRMHRAFRRAEAVVAVSHETARVLERQAGLDPAKVSVVYEGADSFLLPEPTVAATREPRLLVVSALVPYKNIDVVLEVHARLRAQRPELTLEIVGEDWRGHRSLLERRAGYLGTQSSVRFRGAVVGDELVRLYTTSSVLLAFSEVESFGLPIVEAMRFGLPVVIADRSSLPEIAGGAALVVEPRRLAETVATVEALLEDEAQQDELRRRGRCRAAELSWATSATGLAEVVERAARCGRRRDARVSTTR
jgi:glycosyltransferase involved in cell wall biosynthesis